MRENSSQLIENFLTRSRHGYAAPDNALTADMKKRRHAIQLFMNNPEAAIEQYPDLKADLISFFSHSSNPYSNQLSGGSTMGRELEYEKWEKVQKWAKERLSH